MRIVPLSLAALVCSLAVPFVAPAQTPIKGGVTVAPRKEKPASEEVVIEPGAPAVSEAPPPSAVFEAYVAPAPEPAPEPEAKPLPAHAIDPRALTETISNSVVNASGAWDPTLGQLSTGIPEIDRYILDSGRRHGVDPKLVYAVMHQESTFKRYAVSHKGASGYMQLMPGTARRFGVTDIFDPKQNIDAGVRYLRFLLDLFDNNVELALAGYNAGEYRVIREGYRVPRIRETQDYVRKITARYYGKAQKRRFAVTYGPARITAEERAEVAAHAFSTTDDRGTDGLFNIY